MDECLLELGRRWAAANAASEAAFVGVAGFEDAGHAPEDTQAAVDDLRREIEQMPAKTAAGLNLKTDIIASYYDNISDLTTDVREHAHDLPISLAMALSLARDVVMQSGLYTLGS